MSFQNFESFQNQHPAADAAAAAPGAPATADTMAGQADPTTAQFQGPAPGEPTAAPVQPAQEERPLSGMCYLSRATPFPLGLEQYG